MGVGEQSEKQKYISKEDRFLPSKVYESAGPAQ